MIHLGRVMMLPGQVSTPAVRSREKNIDGALVEAVWGGGSCCTLQGSGMGYSWEALQGLFVSVELLYRTGSYSDAYQWSNQALKRAVDFMQRSGWGITSPATYVPWLANARYGTNYPTTTSASGRIMSWGDWLYRPASSAPAPQPTVISSPSAIRPTTAPVQPTTTPISLPPTAIPTLAPPTSAATTIAPVQPTVTSVRPTSVPPTSTSVIVIPTFTSVPLTVTPTAVRIQPSPTATVQATAGAPQSVGSGMWISRNELASRPTSGQAWENMRSAAYEGWGTADLKNQDNKHAIYTLAGALVYARTGDGALRAKVRDGILAAKRSMDESGEWQTDNGVLAAGRQLGAYVISADLIGLKSFDANADNEFRGWLSSIRTTNIGTHGRWRAITYTCENAAANWGTFACASRIAASIYLGDTADVNRSAAIIRAFLGERSAYPANAPGRNGYFEHTGGYDPSWACNDAAWTGINPGCVKSGVNLDGVLVEDAARGGGCCTLQGSGVGYSWEALQGLFVSAELLYRTGAYGDPYQWSNQALKRAVDFMQRSGWGISNVAKYVPWMANYRYGTNYSTAASITGRILSWGDWMYQR